MPIRSNGFAGDPNLARAAENLKQLFAAPSGSDAAGWAIANERNQKAQQLTELLASTTDADKRATYLGSYNPTQSWSALAQDGQIRTRGQDMESGDRRYGTDVGARTTLSTNAADNVQRAESNRLDNQTKGLSTLYPVMKPGETFAGIPDDMAAAIFPHGSPAQHGLPEKLTVDQVKAGQLQSGIAAGKVSPDDVIAAAMGDPKLEQVQGPNGPVFARAAQAVGQRPATDVTKVGEQSGKLRGEIAQLPSYKNYNQAAPIYRSMMDTAGRDTKASDLNLVYGLGKIMDPTSVVREGEMVLVQNTSSLPDWFHGAVNKLNGGAALTPETRAALMREAHSRMRSYEDSLQTDVDRYGAIADRSGVRREDVLPSFERSKPFELPAKPATPVANVQPVKVTTPEEAMQLEPGTPIILPDGSQGIVPQRPQAQRPAPRAAGESGGW